MGPVQRTRQAGWDSLPATVEITEMGTRDGFQAEPRFVPTDQKVAVVDALSRTGVAAIQVSSVVHPKAVPQLTDAEEVMERIERRPGVRYTLLVPNVRGAERAIPLRADVWELMLSVSDAHSRSNANRTTDAQLRALEPVVKLARDHGVDVIGGMATALGCPFEGRVPFERVAYVAEAHHAMGVCALSIADTVGVADPRLVYETLAGLRDRFPDIHLALHLHNTRGMALANVLAALRAGVDSFDAAIGGLGGCPFAPGATGNVATEDLVHMLELMGIETGVDLDKLMTVSNDVRRIVDHPLESAVARAGKATDLHQAPEAQVLVG